MRTTGSTYYDIITPSVNCRWLLHLPQPECEGFYHRATTYGQPSAHRCSSRATGHVLSACRLQLIMSSSNLADAFPPATHAIQRRALQYRLQPRYLRFFCVFPR